jgi:hypothetical protein
MLITVRYGGLGKPIKVIIKHVAEKLISVKIIRRICSSRWKLVRPNMEMSLKEPVGI